MKSYPITVMVDKEIYYQLKHYARNVRKISVRKLINEIFKEYNEKLQTGIAK